MEAQKKLFRRRIKKIFDNFKFFFYFERQETIVELISCHQGPILPKKLWIKKKYFTNYFKNFFRAIVIYNGTNELNLTLSNTF